MIRLLNHPTIQRPTVSPFFSMVGADLRAARPRPSKGTARPEVGPYRRADQARGFSPDNSNDPTIQRFNDPTIPRSNGQTVKRLTHHQTCREALP